MHARFQAVDRRHPSRCLLVSLSPGSVAGRSRKLLAQGLSGHSIFDEECPGATYSSVQFRTFGQCVVEVRFMERRESELLYQLVSLRRSEHPVKVCQGVVDVVDDLSDSRTAFLMVWRNASAVRACPVPVFVDRSRKRNDSRDVTGGSKFPDFLAEVMLAAVFSATSKARLPLKWISFLWP